jgi:hypothetical protein
VSGDGTLDLVTLELARTSIDGIRGRVEVDPGAIEMTGVEASMLGARFSAEGGLRFDGTAEDPYTLHLASSFEGLDLGRLFRTVVPDEPPTLEGVYDVYTSASGEGRNPADLGLGTLGEMRVSGRDGVFRGLAGQYTLVRRGTSPSSPWCRRWRGSRAPAGSRWSPGCPSWRARSPPPWTWRPRVT